MAGHGVLELTVIDCNYTRCVCSCARGPCINLQDFFCILQCYEWFAKFAGVLTSSVVQYLHWFLKFLKDTKSKACVFPTLIPLNPAIPPSTGLKAPYKYQTFWTIKSSISLCSLLLRRKKCIFEVSPGRGRVNSMWQWTTWKA